MPRRQYLGLGDFVLSFYSWGSSLWKHSFLTEHDNSVIYVCYSCCFGGYFVAMHFVKKKIQSAFMLGVNAFWIGKKSISVLKGHQCLLLFISRQLTRFEKKIYLPQILRW